MTFNIHVFDVPVQVEGQLRFLSTFSKEVKLKVLVHDFVCVLPNEKPGHASASEMPKNPSSARSTKLERRLFRLSMSYSFFLLFQTSLSNRDRNEKTTAFFAMP